MIDGSGLGSESGWWWRTRAHVFRIAHVERVAADALVHGQEERHVREVLDEGDLANGVGLNAAQDVLLLRPVEAAGNELDLQRLQPDEVRVALGVELRVAVALEHAPVKVQLALDVCQVAHGEQLLRLVASTGTNTLTYYEYITYDSLLTNTTEQLEHWRTPWWSRARTAP